MSKTEIEKVEIKKIVLKVGDEEISLTLENAKKMKEILDELFGKTVIREDHHHHHHDYIYHDWMPIKWYSAGEGREDIGCPMWTSENSVYTCDNASNNLNIGVTFDSNTLMLSI